jgi:hypothetical protein
MKSRNLVLSLTTAAALALPMLAGAQVFVDVDREAGFILQNPAPAAVTKSERVAPKADATLPTGGSWRETRGNAGWVYVGHQYALRDGKWVCIDGIDHSQRADFSPLDKSLYSGG